MSGQLSLFTPQFDERVRRVVVDGVMYFSVLDVFQHFGSKGSADNPRQYWARAKKRLEDQAGTDVSGLIHRTPDNGGRPSPYATFRFFLRLAQVVEIQEWEPLRQWMADVAHERIEEAANPELGISRARARAIERYRLNGLDTKWIDARLRTIDFRNIFTDALKHYVQGTDYAKATDAVYVGIFEMTARQLRRALGLSDRANIRDALGWQALMYVALAEGTIADSLEFFGSVMDWEDAYHIIRTTCDLIGRQARETQALTGRPLLTDRRSEERNC